MYILPHVHITIYTVTEYSVDYMFLYMFPHD